MKEDPIGKALEVEENLDINPSSAPQMSNVSDDEKNVRENLYGLIEKATEAVGDLSRIAQASQDNESYSALASLLRTAGGLNKNLLDVGTSAAYRTTRIEKPNVTNNTLVLTTTELQKLLESKKS